MVNLSTRIRLTRRIGCLVVGSLFLALTASAPADDTREEAIRKDRKQIAGTWRIVSFQIDGRKSTGEDAAKLRVTNGADGTWSLRHDGSEISRGTSTIDPTRKLKTIDIVTVDANGTESVALGIYELGETTRKLCAAQPGKARPSEFASEPGSGWTLVMFELEKDSAIQRDRMRIAGTWRIVSLAVNGTSVAEEDARKITVENGSDGTWTVLEEGKVILKGTSTIDPLKQPKTLDFTPTEGDSKGTLHLGIYELGETTRRMCFSPPGQGRPTEFASTPGSETILLTFQRLTAPMPSKN